MMIKETIIR